MEKNKMLRAFEEKVETYRVSHPSTAEMDIVIFRAHCSGKNATQISMDIPCAESTVYRAIRRVKEFLQKPEIIPFIDVLKMHIASSPPSYGAWNIHSVLDMLYVAFTNYNKIAPEEAKHHLQELRLSLEQVPSIDFDNAINIVSNLCNNYERSGFTEGLKLGIHLANELNQEMEIV